MSSVRRNVLARIRAAPKTSREWIELTRSDADPNPADAAAPRASAPSDPAVDADTSPRRPRNAKLALAAVAVFMAAAAATGVVYQGDDSDAEDVTVAHYDSDERIEDNRAAREDPRPDHHSMEEEPSEDKSPNDAEVEETETAEAEAEGPEVADVAGCESYSGNRNVACAMVSEQGLGGDQMQCLDDLWEHESGWNESASNPSSGAYGIPQSLPGDKMASHGDDWQTNPATQIAWGLDYIADRYGDPCGAWSFWQGNNWY